MSTCSGSVTSSTFPGITTTRSPRRLLFTSTWGEENTIIWGETKHWKGLNRRQTFLKSCCQGSKISISISVCVCVYLCMLCHSAGLYSIDFPSSSLGCKEGEDPWATTDIQNHLQGEEEETRHHVSATIHIQWLDNEMNNKMSHPHTAASVFYACVCVHRNTHITTTWSAALLTQIFIFIFFKSPPSVQTGFKLFFGGGAF